MSDVFVLQNQHQQFLSKQGEWVDGRDAQTLYRTPHKDEALNQGFEAGAKDYTLRVTTLRCQLSERGVPQIPEEQLSPLPLSSEPLSSEEQSPEPLLLEELPSEELSAEPLFSEELSSEGLSSELLGSETSDTEIEAETEELPQEELALDNTVEVPASDDSDFALDN